MSGPNGPNDLFLGYPVPLWLVFVPVIAVYAFIAPAIGWLVAVFWAIYLTLTMAFIEMNHITPQYTRGPFGWTLFVELPRAIIGIALLSLTTIANQ